MTITKSQKMTIYNRARAAARQGKLPERLVNIALGKCQQNDQSWRERYHTTSRFCGCDYFKYHKICSHQIAIWFEVRSEIKNASKVEESKMSELPGYISPSDLAWVAAVQETYGTWKLYRFSYSYSKEEIVEWARVRNIKLINPADVRGTRIRPDELIL